MKTLTHIAAELGAETVLVGHEPTTADEFSQRVQVISGAFTWKQYQAERAKIASEVAARDAAIEAAGPGDVAVTMRLMLRERRGDPLTPAEAAYLDAEMGRA